MSRSDKIQKKRNQALKIELKSTNGLYINTVNPCNDFLVDFLISSKLKGEKQGIGKFTTYNLAIESVRKYPLPIICEAQLAALEGFGDFFINEGAKRIQKHYLRGRLPTESEQEEDDREHFEAQQKNRRKGYRRKDRPLDEYETNNASQNNSDEYNDGNSGANGSEAQSSVRVRASSSNLSKSATHYVPKIDSEPEKLLKAMYMANAQYKSVTKGEINEILYNWRKLGVGTWDFVKGKLRDASYLVCDPQHEDMIMLTEKGAELVRKRLTAQDLEFIKVNAQACNFTVKKEGKTFLAECCNPDSLKVIVDSSTDLTGRESELIERILGEDHGKEVVFAELEECTFMWKLEEKVLDYAFVRVEVTSQKFDMDEFLTAIHSAKYYGAVNNVFVVVELAEDAIQGSLNLEEIRRIISEYRSAGGKIMQVGGFEETLEIVAEYTRLIEYKLRNLKAKNQTIEVYPFDKQAEKDKDRDYNHRVLLAKSVGSFYQRMLMVFTGGNKQASQLMYQKFGSFMKLHDKLAERFAGLEERKKCLAALLKQSNVDNVVICKIINFVYATNYDEL